MGNKRPLAFQSTKLAYFLCSQCTYLTQEMGALQEGCDCLPCSHLNFRLCHGIWAVAPGREQHGRERGSHTVTAPLHSTWGAWCPLCSLLLLWTRSCQPRPFVAAGRFLLSLGCRVRAVPPLFSLVLPLQCWCAAAAWQSSVQGWGRVLLP